MKILFLYTAEGSKRRSYKIMIDVRLYFNIYGFTYKVNNIVR